MDTTTPTDLPDPAKIELSDPDQVWDHPRRDALFKALRDHAPVKWMSEPEMDVGFEPGPGYWAVTRYDDVRHVSRHPELFCSGQGFNIFDMPEFIVQFFGSMIGMDAPEHTRLRKLVNSRFTPRQIRRIDDIVRQSTVEIIEEMAPLGSCDVVDRFAARLPLRIISRMMGVPPEEENRVLSHTNFILSGGDPEWEPSIERLVTAGTELSGIAAQLARERLEDPRDDLISALVHAGDGDDGEPLTDAEIGSFFILLMVAGSETTRNAIAWGIYELTRHPEQREIWAGDVEIHSATAVEEVVRWASPVMHFRRTATADTRIGDQDIAAGDKVVVWYPAANRDERHFPDPYKFDVRRDPNDHQGFGAGGPHFCLGANLARLEIRVAFEELFTRLPDLAASGGPDRLKSNFVNGIKRLPVSFTARDSVGI